MARGKVELGNGAESVISIIGPGMKVHGNLETDGTVRIEGTVEGNVNAGKGVVVGRSGTVHGDVQTQDAVIAGTVIGTLAAGSRLEMQSTCRVEGEINARRMKLDEGATLDGTVKVMADDQTVRTPTFEELTSGENAEVQEG